MPPFMEDFEALKRLEKQIEFMICSHQIIVDVASTPDLASKLRDLYDSDVRSRMSADPLKHARAAGVKLPEKGVNIQIHEFPGSWTVEIQVEVGKSFVILGFDSRKGFFNR